jgi:excisionase family DNA binding protein
MTAAADMMTVKEMAKYLKVNKKTLYDAVKQGEFPGVIKTRRSIRIHLPTVLSRLATGEGLVKQRKQSK